MQVGTLQRVAVKFYPVLHAVQRYPRQEHGQQQQQQMGGIAGATGTTQQHEGNDIGNGKGRGDARSVGNAEVA